MSKRNCLVKSLQWITFYVLIFLPPLLHAELNPLQKPLIFAGTANRELAQQIAKKLGTKLGMASVDKFKDKEINIQIKESVRNRDVFIIQSTVTTATGSVNDHVMELYLI